MGGQAVATVEDGSIVLGDLASGDGGTPSTRIILDAKVDCRRRKREQQPRIN